MHAVEIAAQLAAERTVASAVPVDFRKLLKGSPFCESDTEKVTRKVKFWTLKDIRDYLLSSDLEGCTVYIAGLERLTDASTGRDFYLLKHARIREVR